MEQSMLNLRCFVVIADDKIFSLNVQPVSFTVKLGSFD